MRGLFEIALRKGYPTLAIRLLTLSKTIDKRLWHDDNPLRQFTILGPELMNKLEAKNATIPRLRDMRADDIGETIQFEVNSHHSCFVTSLLSFFPGHLVHHVRMGQTIKSCVQRFPSISIAASIQPITRTVLRVRLTIRSEFEWHDKLHGNTEPWWIWVEDPDRQHIYHSEYFLLHKKQVCIT